MDKDKTWRKFNFLEGYYNDKKAILVETDKFKRIRGVGPPLSYKVVVSSKNSGRKILKKNIKTFSMAKNYMVNWIKKNK